MHWPAPCSFLSLERCEFVSSKRNLIVVILLTVLAIPVRAAEPAGTGPSGPAFQRPEIIRREGEPVMARWKDGREATIFINRNKPGRVSAAFKVESNECTEVTDVECRLVGYGRSDRFEMRWTVHSDPEKKGKTVKSVERVQSGNSTVLETRENDLKATLSFDWTGKKFYPKATADIPPYELHCEDYGWLPGGQGKTAPATITFPLWEVESMFSNPETEMNENATSGGAIGVTLRRAKEGHLEFSDIGELTSRYSSEQIFGDPMALTARGAGGELCHIVLRASLEEANEQSREYRKNLPDSYEPYLFGSDEALKYFSYGPRGFLFDVSTKEAK